MSGNRTATNTHVEGSGITIELSQAGRICRFIGCKCIGIHPF